VGADELDALIVPMVNLAPDGGELYVAAQIRLFRPERAWYVGRLHEQVQRRPGCPASPALRSRELARAVIQVRHLGYTDPAVVQAKARRNLALATAEVQTLLAAEVPDDEQLARVLYHRGRTLLSAGQFSGAVDDLQAVRRLPVSCPERTWGRDVLAQLMIALGRSAQAQELIEELRAAGVDERYCRWLRARTLLAREEYDPALELLRTIDLLVDSVGRVLDLAPVLEAQMIAAGRLGQVDEAAACCIRLMAGMGRTAGMGPMLLALWAGRPPAWLVDLLSGADRGHLAAVAQELQGCADPGPAVAAGLLGRPV
jgi:tetratricopeptide (TPR) repeat protein